MAKPEEQVLVVKRELSDRLGSFQGLCADVDRYLGAFLERSSNFFVPRSSADNDPSLQQIIPHAIFTHGGIILHYTRGAGSGEKRLVAKDSIGIGGHINDSDETLFSFDRSAYHNAVAREICEDLRLGEGSTEHPVALINDDSSEVGRVHLGVLHIVALESDDVRAGEQAIASLGFATREDLLTRRDSLESWSQIALDGLTQLGGDF